MKEQSTNTVLDFKEGDTVVYVQKPKQENRTLDDCEPGRVTSINDRFVFVQFMDKYGEYSNPHSQACSPCDLWIRP